MIMNAPAIGAGAEALGGYLYDRYEKSQGRC
jgi:hypothetical protein